MINARSGPVMRWPADHPAGRKVAAPIVLKAFTWSPATAALAVAGGAVSALTLAPLLWALGAPWSLMVFSLLFPYPIVMLTYYVTSRWVLASPGDTWWSLVDERGRAAVMTKPVKGGTCVYYLAAVPRGRGLGRDLMRHVAAQADETVAGYAWPSAAETYVGWGYIDHGRQPWRFVHQVEFTRSDTLSGDRR